MMLWNSVNDGRGDRILDEKIHFVNQIDVRDVHNNIVWCVLFILWGWVR